MPIASVVSGKRRKKKEIDSPIKIALNNLTKLKKQVRNMKKYILIFLAVGLFYSCQKKQDKTFNFAIYEDIDSIDTKSGILSRQYLKGRQSFHFKLTKNEMAKILKLYESKQLDKLPDNYESTCKVFEIPPSKERFIIYYNGEKKTFIYDYFYEYKDLDSTKVQGNIKSFRDSVMKIIYDNKGIKEIKACDIIRL